MYSSITIGLLGNSGTYNFSTFRENAQIESFSLLFSSSDYSLTHTVSYCNIIGNKCGADKNQVLFYCISKTNLDHCIFLNNTAKYMFGQDIDGYNSTISDSYVDSNSTTGSGTVIFKNIKEGYDFNTFTHIFNENCSIVSHRIISLKSIFLSKFAKTATAGLFSRKV